MLKGFRHFITRGNVVDLATAVVIGTAFTAVVTALVESVLMPLISALVGTPDFDDFAVVMLNDTPIRFGVLLTALVNFLLIAGAVYFVIIAPMTRMIEARERRSRAAPPAAEDENISLLREIRDQLKAQTEVTNPAFLASLAEAQRQAAEDAEQQSTQGPRRHPVLGKAKDVVWGKD
ncbi:large conductance mechanosensitive channel protein MscL [Nesterenkonia sp. E16_7]|uniref:large conductance mechanosensitive channel protein MscL n=1 Tax=unclassified Nesterenkonia TaxID=2629769 RepID=UPI001A91DDC3|nr:large conductance mechanosensitive channel protein MscL [Nesterenkonia sp. E16_10]MBO0597594.1 large conductance mechanosensitive channel protein MscL [Nesterenkonia sp. E16_7]